MLLAPQTCCNGLKGCLLFFAEGVALIAGLKGAGAYLTLFLRLNTPMPANLSMVARVVRSNRRASAKAMG